MTVSAITHYRGGTIDVGAPVAKKSMAAYLKHGSSTPTRRPLRRRRQLSRKTPNANLPLPTLQSSRRELAERWLSISIFDRTAGFFFALYPTCLTRSAACAYLGESIASTTQTSTARII